MAYIVQKSITKRFFPKLVELMLVLRHNKVGSLEVGMTSELSMNSSVPFLYASLLYGYTLNIIYKKAKDDMYNFINELNCVDICDVNPSIIYRISKYISKNRGIKLYTKVFVSSGEELKKATAHSFFEQCAFTTIINVYGMATCTIQNAMFYINKENEEKLKKIPIGKPIRNTRIYILDLNKKIVGVQCIGDIWISGDGLNTRELENEILGNIAYDKDIINYERKMFNTGDKGYFDLDGNIYLS